MYYNIPKEEMSAFEKARKLLLQCAFSKALWESLEVTNIPYLRVVQSRIDFYDVIIKECYKLIDSLRKEGNI